MNRNPEIAIVQSPQFFRPSSEQTWVEQVQHRNCSTGLSRSTVIAGAPLSASAATLSIVAQRWKRSVAQQKLVTLRMSMPDSTRSPEATSSNISLSLLLAVFHLIPPAPSSLSRCAGVLARRRCSVTQNSGNRTLVSSRRFVICRE